MASRVTTEVNNVLKPVDAAELHHLPDCEAAYQVFSWEQAHPEFDWAKTGKVNMTHEAIDRQLARGRRNKLALIYTDRQRPDALRLRICPCKATASPTLCGNLPSLKGIAFSSSCPVVPSFTLPFWAS